MPPHTPGSLCMMISLAASSSPPKVAFYCPCASCLHSIVTGQVQISSFYEGPSSERGLGGVRLGPGPHPLIRPSAEPPLSAGPSLSHNAAVAFRAFMLAVV